MPQRVFFGFCVFLLSVNSLLAQSNNPADPNNTSACAPSSQAQSSWCSGFFNGLSDHINSTHTTNSSGQFTFTSGTATFTDTMTTVPQASNVSWVPFTRMLNAASTTGVVCFYEPWWGLGSHIDNGMNLQTNAAAIVAQQASNMVNRGCNLIILDWYGPGSSTAQPGTAAYNAFHQDEVALAWRDYLDGQCSQGNCTLHMAVMDDDSTRTEAAFESDTLYASSTYFQHSSYWTMSVAGCTRPVEASFGWGGFSDTNWGHVKTSVQATLGTCNGDPLIIAEGPSGIDTFFNLDGAYNWIGVDAYKDSVTSPFNIYSSNDANTTTQYNRHFVTASQDTDPNKGAWQTTYWYQRAAANLQGQTTVPTKPVIIGSVYAGFNDTNATWGFDPTNHPIGRKMSRECGLTWVDSWQQPANASTYFQSHALPFVGIATWNEL